MIINVAKNSFRIFHSFSYALFRQFIILIHDCFVVYIFNVSVVQAMEHSFGNMLQSSIVPRSSEPLTLIFFRMEFFNKNC